MVVQGLTWRAGRCAMIVACLTGCAGAAVSSTGRAEPVRGVAEYFRRAAAFGYTGTVAVGQAGVTLLNAGYGLADWQTGEPVAVTTAYDIASLDKQFIAAAILVLEQQGKLQTTDSLSRFFPVPSDKAGITLHHLLSLTSGIEDVYWDQHPEMSHDAFVAFVLNQTTLLAPPGEQFSYASANYWILERVIERVSGQDFETFLRDNLFRPAGMELTGTLLPHWADGQVARLRAWSTGTWEVGGIDYGNVLARSRPFRTLLSTSGDLAKWYQELRSGTILVDSSKAKLFTPVEEGYGYGWNIEPTRRGTTALWHGGSGSGGGMRVHFRYFPSEDLFFAVLNGAVTPSIQGEYLATDIEGLLLGGPVSMPPAPLPIDSSISATLIGEWSLPGGGRFRIAMHAAGDLLLESDDPRAIPTLRFPELAMAPDSIPQNLPYRAAVEGIVAGDYSPLLRLVANPARHGAFVRYGARLHEGAKAFGALRSATTLYERVWEYRGVPEQHVFIGARMDSADVVVRVLRDGAGEPNITVLEPGTHHEVMLARVGDRVFAAWDFALGRDIRFTPTLQHGKAMLQIRGAHGMVLAARVGP